MRYFQNLLKFVPANNRSPKVVVIFQQLNAFLLSIAYASIAPNLSLWGH